MEFWHTSVLLRESVDALRVSPDGIYVDGTLGGGGHSREIARRLTGTGRLIGIDRDEAAIEASEERLKEFGSRVTIIRGNYSKMKEYLLRDGITSVDGILLDLGVSSYQLDDAGRGFTYQNADALLDMRMDRRQELTAREVVNSYSVDELDRIIRDYGEERFSDRIARNIVSSRSRREIRTAGELAAIIRRAIPERARAIGRHPARRTFQAIRIEVNGELEGLKNSLDGMIDLLNEDGRICIITFHSLEDRIVKNTFRKAENPCTCPPQFPMCVCGKKSRGRVVTKKPIIPSIEEMKRNRRSKSAKLRVFEKKEADLYGREKSG